MAVFTKAEQGLLIDLINAGLTDLIRDWNDEKDEDMKKYLHERFCLALDLKEKVKEVFQKGE